MVGKLAQVAVDRTIGTVLGGTSGFGAYVGYKCATNFSLPLCSAMACLFEALLFYGCALPGKHLL